MSGFLAYFYIPAGPPNPDGTQLEEPIYMDGMDLNEPWQLPDPNASKPDLVFDEEAGFIKAIHPPKPEVDPCA